MYANERTRRSVEIELRGHPLDPGIIAALPDLFARSFRHHGRSHYSARQIEAALATDDGGGYGLFRGGGGLVAMADGALAGCGALGGSDAGSGHGAPFPRPGDGAAAIVRAFCTDPAFSGIGIGKALMNRLLALARARGASELRLTATLCAVRFYEKCGFTAGHRIEIPCANGVMVPAMPMTLHLEPALSPPA